MCSIDTGIEAIMLSFFFVIKRFNEVLHAGKFFEIPKKVQQKDADRIISLASETVFLSDNGSYKRKIDKGGDETGKTAGNPSIWMDLNMSRPEGVFG